MAKNKTTENEASVADFINKVADENKRADCFKVVELIEKETGLSAKMWGSAIVGFGSYHYKYESGREGDAPLVGFSPRANAITFYISTGVADREELLTHLGKHTTGKGCIYIKNLSDIDTNVLKKLVSGSVKYTQNKYK